jgi:hypothetical protein
MTDVANSQSVLCQIANCAFEVVGNLLNRDQLLAEKLRSPETVSRQIYREECITLEMASTLKERFPEQIDLTIFTPAEEARNGADWYWRVQKGNFAIHARVQAKRVQRSAFGQLDSDGAVDFDASQLRRLLDATNSARSSVPDLQAWIATFARYDATPPCGGEPSECRKHGCNQNCEGMNRLPSIWIAQAQDFTNGKFLDQSMVVRQVVESSLRLDCILPCIDPRNSDGPARKGFVLTPGLPSFDDCIAAIDRNSALNGTFEGAIQIKV